MSVPLENCSNCLSNLVKMSAAGFNDSGGEETNDGYYHDYIMENIKSPVKASTSAQPTRTSPRKTKKSIETSAAPVPDPKIFKKTVMGSPMKTDVRENERDQYIENLRKLIITARNRISELEEKNNALQKRVDSDCMVRCPACCHKFKEKDHVVLPKFMRIFRPRLSLEMEFYNEEELDNYVEANRIGHDRDGVPVQIPVRKPKNNLQDVGSKLSEYVQEREVKSPGVKLRISLKKEPRVMPVQEPLVPPQPPSNFVPAGSETPQDGLVIAEESDADSVINSRTTERQAPPRTPGSVSRKPSDSERSRQIPASSENRGLVEERRLSETKGMLDPREEAVALSAKKVDSRLRKQTAKEVVNEPAIMRETFGNVAGSKSEKEAPGRQGVDQKLPPTEVKNATEGPRRNIASRISYPKPAVPSKQAISHDPRTPVSSRVACPPTSSAFEESASKEHSTPSTLLSTNEWRDAMSGIFANPSGEIGLELPPKCALPSRKLPEVLPSTTQPEAPVLPAPIVLPEATNAPKTPRRISPRKRQLEKDLELSASPEPRPAVNTAASRNERYRNRIAAKEAEDKKDQEGPSQSSERRARRDVQYRESPPNRRDQSLRLSARSSDTDRTGSVDRGGLRDARSIAIEHQKQKEETGAVPLKSSENHQADKSRRRSPSRRRKEDEAERRRDEERIRRERDEEDRRKREREEMDRKRDEDRRKRDREDVDRRKRERDEVEKRISRDYRPRKDYQRVVDSYAGSANSVPVGQRKLPEPANLGRSRRRSPDETTSRRRQAASRPSRRSPVERKSSATRTPAATVRTRGRSPVEDTDAPHLKRPRRNSSPAQKARASPEAGSSSKEEGEITDDDDDFPTTEASRMPTRSSSHLSDRAAAGRDREPQSSERSVIDERRNKTPEYEAMDQDGDSDDSATIEVYDEVVPIETLKMSAKLPVTFGLEEEKQQENPPFEDEDLSEELEPIVIIDEQEEIIGSPRYIRLMEDNVSGGEQEMRRFEARVDSEESDAEDEEENEAAEAHDEKQEEEESRSSRSSVDPEEAGSEEREHVEQEHDDEEHEHDDGESEGEDEAEDEPGSSQGILQAKVEDFEPCDEQPDEEMEESDAGEQGSSSSDDSEHSAEDEGSGSSSEDEDEDEEENEGNGKKSRKNSTEDEGSGGDDDFAEWGQIVEKDEDVFSDSFVPDDDDIE